VSILSFLAGEDLGEVSKPPPPKPGPGQPLNEWFEGPGEVAKNRGGTLKPGSVGYVKKGAAENNESRDYSKQQLSGPSLKSHGSNESVNVDSEGVSFFTRDTEQYMDNFFNYYIRRSKREGGNHVVVHGLGGYSLNHLWVAEVFDVFDSIGNTQFVMRQDQDGAFVKQINIPTVKREYAKYKLSVNHAPKSVQTGIEYGEVTMTIVDNESCSIHRMMVNAAAGGTNTNQNLLMNTNADIGSSTKPLVIHRFDSLGMISGTYTFHSPQVVTIGDVKLGYAESNLVEFDVTFNYSMFDVRLDKRPVQLADANGQLSAKALAMANPKFKETTKSNQLKKKPDPYVRSLRPEIVPQEEEKSFLRKVSDSIKSGVAKANEYATKAKTAVSQVTNTINRAKTTVAVVKNTAGSVAGLGTAIASGDPNKINSAVSNSRNSVSGGFDNIGGWSP
jgi:hypothetical protein